MAKYKCIVEYEYPVDHKPPVKAEIILHGDSVTSNNVTPFTDRPHGEWVHGREISQMWTGDKLVGIDYEDFSCSCCGVVVEESTEPQWNFCPNCGASMSASDRQVTGKLNSEIEKSKSEIVPDYRDGWRLREGEAE